VSDPAARDPAARAQRRVRLFGTALLATVVVTVLPLPWRLSGLGFGVIALCAGIRLLLDLARLRRAGRPAGGWLGVTAGLAVSAFVLLILGGQLAFYPLFAEQQRCSDRAVTHLDAAGCRAAFEQHRQEIFGRLGAG
jgi:hypothetical protein